MFKNIILFQELNYLNASLYFFIKHGVIGITWDASLKIEKFTKDDIAYLVPYKEWLDGQAVETYIF